MNDKDYLFAEILDAIQAGNAAIDILVVLYKVYPEIYNDLLNNRCKDKFAIIFRNTPFDTLWRKLENDHSRDT